MGLDWVILAKEPDGIYVDPTETIGAKRASRTDPEVITQLRRIWESGEKAVPFEDFVEDLVSSEVPPIVISYGDGAEEARPVVMAEVQYYGYRASVIEPRFNHVSEFAEDHGIDMSWLYDEMKSPLDIAGKIQLMEEVLEMYRVENPEIVSEADRCYRTWLQAPGEDLETIERYSGGNADMQTQLFEVFSFIGAIGWLRFWADKGFMIAADY